MNYILGLTLLGSIVAITEGTGTGSNNNGFFFFAAVGGFSVDDSIIAYFITGQLKKLFQGTIRAVPYKPRPKKFINRPSDLDCDFQRNASCNWHNVDNDGGRGGTNLFAGYGKPNTKNITWSLVTGSNQTPDPPFGLIVSQRTNTSIWWVSNPIRAQLKPASISLKAWISPQASMKVCARLYDKSNDPTKRKVPFTFVQCTRRLRYNTTPGPHKLYLRSPIKKPFELVMVFGPWPLKQGGIIAIDDIKYRSPPEDFY
jgi:hypothetical protein